MPDFKPTSVVALSGLTALEELPEGGEIKAARMADSAETYLLRTYARSVMLTRCPLRNVPSATRPIAMRPTYLS